jgi:hypothetical protein
MIELLPFQLLVFYLVPFLVAAARGHDAAGLILVANLLLGWTGIGWIAVLVFALKSQPSARVSARRR